MQQTGTLRVTAPSDTTIVMTREFRAPRPAVWDAMTKPELVRRWMGCPPGWTWEACEMDVRVGGRFRWAWNGPDGKLALSFSGAYRVVAAPARIVYTERMETGPAAGACGPECGSSEQGEVVATVELVERGEQTRMKMTISCPTREVRDIMLASGMEQGMEAAYCVLDRLLAESAP